MTVTLSTSRPAGCRRVPLLAEPDVGHYPEFARFLAATFGLDDDPFGPPGILVVDGRAYELVFVGRSGHTFPAGVEISALAEGLEPLDIEQADDDLLQIMAWLVEGVGPPWTVEALDQTCRIFRIPTRDDQSHGQGLSR